MIPRRLATALRPLAAQACKSSTVPTERSFFTFVDQYQKGVTLTLGKLTGVKEPGFRLRLPIVQTMWKVDMRTRSIDIRPQHLMTSDNVSVHVDAVAFLRIDDAQRSVCEVDDPFHCVEELAQAYLRDELSHSSLEDILHKRGEFSVRIRERVAETAKPWGLEVLDIKLKNIRVDEGMVRALAKKAEAERERQARIIIADAEVSTASKLAEAAKVLDATPAAMKLRELQTYLEIAQENNSTVLLPSSLGSLVGAARSAMQYRV